MCSGNKQVMLGNDSAALFSALETRKRKHRQRLISREDTQISKQVEIHTVEKRSVVDSVCGGRVRGWRGKKVLLEYTSKLRQDVPVPREEHS